MNTPLLFTNLDLSLNNILLPELWDIILYWKWELEMKFINDKNLLDIYIDEVVESYYYVCINDLWDVIIPESKLIFTHMNSQITKDSDIYIRSLIRWKNYYIIFNYDNNDTEDDMDMEYIHLTSYHFKLIHIDSYNDDLFLTEKVLNTMLLPEIIKYFKHSNRNLEDFMSYMYMTASL